MITFTLNDGQVRSSTMCDDCGHWVERSTPYVPGEVMKLGEIANGMVAVMRGSQLVTICAYGCRK